MIPFLIMVCLLDSDSLAQEITVSRIWVDFYGSVSWSDQNPVESGALIQVFDSDSTLCGEFTVTTNGVYGFIAVFGDDSLTPDIDEGAQEGDLLFFEINGVPAQILYGGNPVWSQQHLKVHISLVSTETKIENENRIPLSFELSQNYPNPFNPITKINFSIPMKSQVRLIIYNILGQEIETLINEYREPGRYVVDWNANKFPNGIYLYRLKAGDYVETKKLILQK